MTKPQSGHSFAKLLKKAKDKQIQTRLLNWGKWLRYDDTIAKLGYPRQCPFIFTPQKGQMIADLDAEYLEWIISSINVSGWERGELYAFILKVEYAEKPSGMMGVVGDRAKDVSRRFKRPCASSTYYKHLAKAKTLVQMFAGPIK